jgi:hypothetical protein
LATGSYPLVIPYKKGKYNGLNFDEAYNLSWGRLYFLKRSAIMIATFVRHRKTHAAESGDP